jgi:Asp-tRNA(Asn)/Glu-tRNA(Gln) amidotransferase A subunit family amidase
MYSGMSGPYRHEHDDCLLQATNLKELYKGTRHDGLGSEVKRRILMGTYALSAGFYDAYYKRAQQACSAYHTSSAAAMSI